jgi:hypothetical protein
VVHQGIGAAIVRHIARQTSTMVFFDTNDEASTRLAVFRLRTLPPFGVQH